MTEPRIVFLNDLPYVSTGLDPLEALRDALALSVDDWSESRAMAWVYGIILGWDTAESDLLEDEQADAAMRELAGKYRWSDEQVERLRELHRRFDALESRA